MASYAPDPPQSILILGAGAFGLATALKLATTGYADVVVLEKDDRIPSRFSAGFDLNKVVRAEYADPFYTDISLKAIRQWQTDPLYQPHFRQTGFLNVVSAAADHANCEIMEKYFTSLQKHPDFQGQVVRVSGDVTIKNLVPAFGGPISGWRGYHNQLAGYCHSANAMNAVYEACVEAGVRFYTGHDGDVTELLYKRTSTGENHCIGARSVSGATHLADTIIVALGGSVARLVPQIPRVTGKCWGVVHLQLSQPEAHALRGIPVTNVRDLAFFEPDAETNKLKFCHMGGAYTNVTKSSGGLSLPFPHLADSQFVPLEDEMYIRRLLRKVLPHLADRPFVDSHLCWFADSEDSDYVIDYVPDTSHSLVVLSGDSGHGFKMLPIFGDFVIDLLDHKEQRIHKWRWKDGNGKQHSETPTWRASSTQGLAELERARL